MAAVTPQKMQYEFGSYYPAASSVEAATSPSRFDVMGKFRSLDIKKELYDKKTARKNDNRIIVWFGLMFKKIEKILRNLLFEMSINGEEHHLSFRIIENCCEIFTTFSTFRNFNNRIINVDGDEPPT